MIFTNYLKEVAPGQYPNSTISHVEIEEVKSQFHKSGKRTAVKISIEIPTVEGLAVLEFAPTMSTRVESPFYQTLETLGLLPPPGKSFDLNDLVGLKVLVWVESRESNGRVYCNITKIEKDTISTNNIVADLFLD